MTNLPFGFDSPKSSPGFLLWQTTTLWQRHIKKALEAYDISHAQFVILASLRWFESDACDTTQSDIIAHTKLDKMTVSKSLKKLVSIGFVNRFENITDTRSKNVTLTDSGRAMVDKIVPIIEKIYDNFFGQISKSKQQDLIKNLLQLSRTS